MSQTQVERTAISILTATFNCVDNLPKLLDSLRAQTDKDFEWVVIDGASTDGTLELLRTVADLKIVFVSQPDFGIYDALNHGLILASGNYYIVAGSDDCFAGDAIANYRNAIEQSGADILAAKVMYGRQCFSVKKGPSWLHGEKSFIANHSLGTAFKRDLHDRFGYYSKRFPIAADSLFVLQACRRGAKWRELAFVAGNIGTQGVSAVDWAGSSTELYRVQLIEGGSVIIQTFLLLLRIIKGANLLFRRLFYLRKVR